MGTAKPAAVKGGRFIAGDPLRGLACLVVVFWHVVVNAAGLIPPAGVSPYYQAELGFLGRPIYTLSFSVWVFFALSGYLIAGPFVRAVVRGGDRRPRALPYARNRLLRIVPGFWFFLTLTLVLVGTQGDSLRHIAAFYGFAHIYSQGPFAERMVQAWTLDVEAVFYIFVPLLFLPLASIVGARGAPERRAALVIAGCVLVAVASISMGERFALSGRSVPGSAWSFTPGIALAALEPIVRPRLAGSSLGRWLGRLLLASAAAAFLAAAYLLSFSDKVVQNIAALVVVSGLLGGLLVLQWADAPVSRLLDNRALHWFGVRAYGIYLVHVLALYELRHFTAGLPSERVALVTTFPLVLALSTLAGALSFRFVESPFLERRAPWRSAEPAPVDGAAAAAMQPAVQPAAAQP